MFCNRCGAAIQPDYNVCPKCGVTIIHAGVTMPPPARTESRLARHVRTIGILWIVAGAFWLLPSLALFIAGSPFHVTVDGNRIFPGSFAPPFLFMIGSVFFLVAAAGIFVGLGLMQRQPWARVAGLIVACLVILHPPFGTALGVYTLWVLLSGDAREYESLSRPA